MVTERELKNEQLAIRTILKRLNKLPDESQGRVIEYVQSAIGSGTGNGTGPVEVAVTS